MDLYNLLAHHYDSVNTILKLIETQNILHREEKLHVVCNPSSCMFYVFVAFTAKFDLFFLN